LTIQLVDGAGDLEHPVVGDRPAAVDVVHQEAPWKNTDEQEYVSTTWTGAQSGGARETLARHVGSRGTRTFELFVERASRGDGNGADELLKVDCTIVLAVEYVEGVVRELARIITIVVEPPVDAAETFLVDLATRIVS